MALVKNADPLAAESLLKRQGDAGRRLPGRDERNLLSLENEPPTSRRRKCGRRLARQAHPRWLPLAAPFGNSMAWATFRPSRRRSYAVRGCSRLRRPDATHRSGAPRRTRRRCAASAVRRESLRTLVGLGAPEHRQHRHGERRDRQRQPGPESARTEQTASNLQQTASADGAAHGHRPERRLGGQANQLAASAAGRSQSVAAPVVHQVGGLHHGRDQRPPAARSPTSSAHRRHRLPDQSWRSTPRSRPPAPASRAAASRSSPARCARWPSVRPEAAREIKALIGARREGRHGAPSWSPMPAPPWARSSPRCSASPTSSARSPLPPEQSDGIGQVNTGHPARPDDPAERRPRRTVPPPPPKACATRPSGLAQVVEGFRLRRSEVSMAAPVAAPASGRAGGRDAPRRTRHGRGEARPARSGPDLRRAAPPVRPAPAMPAPSSRPRTSADQQGLHRPLAVTAWTAPARPPCANQACRT